MKDPLSIEHFTDKEPTWFDSLKIVRSFKNFIRQLLTCG